MEQTKPLEYRESAEYIESRPDGQPEPCPSEKGLENRAEGKQGMQREKPEKTEKQEKQDTYSEQSKQEPRRGRIHLIDELRGFAVFCMVFYHGFYSMANLFDMPLGAFLFRFFMPAEPWFAGLFICIAGISSDLSRSNLIRGAKLLLVALLVTGATALVTPQEMIVFGILHFLSICMMGFGLFQLLYGKAACALHKKPRLSFHILPLILCVLLYLLTMELQKGYWGLPFLFRLPVPEAFYSNVFTAALGFPYPGFSSSDYFPLLPWCFVFIGGTVLGRLARAGRFPAFAYKKRIPFFSFLGRHALIIYVFHQPVILGICYGAQALAGLWA